MNYRVIINKPAKKSLDKLPARIKVQLTRTAYALGKDPRPHGYKKLTDRGDYSLRIGDYRIIYLIDDPRQEVVVTVVGDRKEVYRR